MTLNSSTPIDHYIFDQVYEEFVVNLSCVAHDEQKCKIHFKLIVKLISS